MQTEHTPAATNAAETLTPDLVIKILDENTPGDAVRIIRALKGGAPPAPETEFHHTGKTWPEAVTELAFYALAALAFWVLFHG